MVHDLIPDNNDILSIIDILEVVKLLDYIKVDYLGCHGIHIIYAYMHAYMNHICHVNGLLTGTCTFLIQQSPYTLDKNNQPVDNMECSPCYEKSLWKVEAYFCTTNSTLHCRASL